MQQNVTVTSRERPILARSRPRCGAPGSPTSTSRPGGGPSTPPTPRTTGSCRRRWCFPAHADDVAATLATCRELGVPLTARGAGTSIAGNAVGAGVVLDFSRAPEPGAVDRSRGADRGRRAGRDPRLDHRRRGAARAALRPRPVHAFAGHDRRRDRQQRLRLAGAEVRPHGRQRRRARGAHRLGRAAVGPRAARAAPRSAARPACWPPGSTGWSTTSSR